MELWILNLVVHHVALDKSWLETADAAKDWGNALLSEDWKVLPPLWARQREDKWMLEDKNNENTEESLESLPTSPLEEQMKREEEELKESLECATKSPILDCGWGKGLPAPTPTATAPSTPALWRPWEEDNEEEGVVNLSASVQKRKRRSPATAARSCRRLQQWKEKKDKARLVSELPQHLGDQ